MRLEHSLGNLISHLALVKARQTAVEEILVEKGLVSFDDIDQRAAQIYEEISDELLLSTTNLTIEDLDEIKRERNR